MSATVFDRAGSARATKRSAASLSEAVQSLVRVWSGRGFFTLLDQGLISCAGFGMSILLARTLAPQGYGAFALAYEVYLFVTVLYGAFILEPLAVFGSSIYRDSLRGYMRVLLRIHLLLGLAVVLLVGLSAWICAAAGVREGIAQALLGASVAAPCVLLFWLVRRAFYVELAPREAVLGAAVYFVVVIGGLLGVYRFGILSPSKAFLLMALGGLATTATLLSRLKSRLASGAGSPGLANVARTHWQYGRWAAASAVTIWLGNSLYYPLLGTLHGLDEAGKLRALMNFASPISQVFAAMSLLFLPYTARVYHRKGQAAMRRLLWKLTALYICGPALYWVLVVIFRGQAVQFLYAGKYADVAYLMPLVALGSILRISVGAQSTTLRAMQSPALVFAAYSGSCLATLLIGIPFAWAFGLRGALIALVLSNAAALVLALTLAWRRSATGIVSPALEEMAPGRLT